MGNETRAEVVIGGDARGYLAELGKATKGQTDWLRSVEGTQSDLDDASTSATKLAQAMRDVAKAQAAAIAAGKGGLGDGAEKVAAALNDGADAAKRLAEQRSAEADQIAQQLKVLRTLGAEQKEIGDLVQAELRLRGEVATLSGDTAASKRIAQQVELEAIKQIAAAERAAESAAAEAAREAAKADKQASTDRAAADRARERAELDGIRQVAAAKREANERAKEAAQLEAAQIRAKAAEITRTQAIFEQSDQARAADARQIIELEKQALLAERQGATTKLEQLQIDERLRDVARDRALLEKQISREQSGVDKLKAGVAALQAHWMAVVGAVAAVAAAIAAANEAMASTLTQRTIFDNLPFKIEAARGATLGLIDDVELSRMAIEAQRLGVVSSEEGFAKLTMAATKLGLSVGVDAKSSVESLIGALGRGETELLDNLGVTLKAAEAQRLYAEQLGISANALSEEQKAEAFKVIGLQKAVEASEHVKVALNESEQAWVSSRQAMDELVRKSLPEATQRMDGLWKALGEGTEVATKLLPTLISYVDSVLKGLRPLIEVVAFFGGQLGWLGEKVGVLIDALGRGASAVGDFFGGIKDWLADTWVGDAASWIRDTASAAGELASSGLGELRTAAEENIPGAKELGLVYDDLKNSILGVSEAAGSLPINPAKQLNELFAKGKQIAVEAKAAESSKLMAMEEQVAALEHQINMAEASGKPEAEIERLLRAQYVARLDLLNAQGKEKDAAQAILDEEVRRAKAANSRSGSGPSEADRVNAAGKIRLAQLADELGLLELRSEIAGRTEQDQHVFAQRRLELRMAELDAERDTLLVTRARNSVERDTIAARLEGIERERKLALGGASLEATKAAAAAEQALIEKKIAGYDREIERAKALGVEVGLLAELRRQAQQDLLARQGDTEAIAQFDHEQEIARIEEAHQIELDRRASELEAFEQRQQLAEAEGITVRNAFEERFQLEARLAKAQRDGDGLRQALHARDLARIKQRVENERKAIQASGQFLQQGAELASLIIDNAVKDDAKRERAQLRVKGIMAIATAALETVEAAASFARYDFIGGALHTAAAAIGYAQGTIMLAGRIPGGGGGSAGAGASSGPSGGRGGDSFSGDFGGGKPQPAPAPISTDQLDDARGQGRARGRKEAPQQGNVINFNGPVITNDSSYLLKQVGDTKSTSWGQQA